MVFYRRNVILPDLTDSTTKKTLLKEATSAASTGTLSLETAPAPSKTRKHLVKSLHIFRVAMNAQPTYTEISDTVFQILLGTSLRSKVWEAERDLLGSGCSKDWHRDGGGYCRIPYKKSLGCC